MCSKQKSYHHEVLFPCVAASAAITLHFCASSTECTQQKQEVVDGKNLANLWMIKPPTFAESLPQ